MQDIRTEIESLWGLKNPLYYKEMWANFQILHCRQSRKRVYGHKLCDPIVSKVRMIVDRVIVYLPKRYARYPTNTHIHTSIRILRVVSPIVEEWWQEWKAHARASGSSARATGPSARAYEHALVLTHIQYHSKICDVVYIYVHARCTHIHIQYMLAHMYKRPSANSGANFSVLSARRIRHSLAFTTIWAVEYTSVGCILMREVIFFFRLTI